MNVRLAMPEIKSGRFIVTMEVDATYEESIGKLIARLEDETHRMQDTASQGMGKPASIRGVEIIGIVRKT